MMSRRGSWRRQRTISMRWRSPTERSATRAVGSRGRPYSADTLATRSPSAARSSRPGVASAMFSATDSASNSEKCWNTMPIPRRRAAAGLATATGSPRQRSWPVVGWSAPYMILTRVDLPAPFSPSRAWIRPGRSRTVTRSFAVNSPKRFTISIASRRNPPSETASGAPGGRPSLRGPSAVPPGDEAGDGAGPGAGPVTGPFTDRGAPGAGRRSRSRWPLAASSEWPECRPGTRDPRCAPPGCLPCGDGS